MLELSSGYDRRQLLRARAHQGGVLHRHDRLHFLLDRNSVVRFKADSALAPLAAKNSIREGSLLVDHFRGGVFLLDFFDICIFSPHRSSDEQDGSEVHDAHGDAASGGVVKTQCG